MPSPTGFSDMWYAVFADSIPARHTGREMTFLRRHLPLPAYTRILDLCCGQGRHAAPLAASGYAVTGIDDNPAAIARARARVPASVALHVMDLRDLADLEGAFDAAINLWQSFGYFDDAENDRVLRMLADRVRPGGRVVVDLYNRDAVRALPSYDESERNGTRIRTRRTWHGHRLRVEIAYDDDPPADTFDWHIYSPEEWEASARAAGLHAVLRCAWFDEDVAPSPEHARMQFVLEKPS